MMFGAKFNMKFLLQLMLSVCLFISYSSVSYGSDEVNALKSYSSEYTKANYLYQLSRFVEWNEARDRVPFDICIVGSDDFGITLVHIIAELQPSDQIYVLEKDLTSSYDDCEILYVSQYAQLELDHIWLKVKGAKILTVSDVKGFLSLGGMIELSEVEKRIKLKINNTRVKESGLRASVHILEIAEEVR